MVMFSIIVASYNYDRYILKTLDSLAKQTYNNYEVIIVDDGSLDNSIKKIKTFTDKYENFYLYTHKNNQNKGLIETLKLGVSKARGEYVCFCESDDYWDVHHLEEKFKFIQNNPRSVLIINDIFLVGDGPATEYVNRVMDIARKSICLKNHFHLLEFENDAIPTFSIVTIKKNVLRSLNFSSPIGAWLDWWLWRQVAIKYPVNFIDKKLTYWRLHQVSYNSKEMVNKELQIRNNKELLLRKSNNYIKRHCCFEYIKYKFSKNIKKQIICKIHEFQKNIDFISLGYNCLTRRVLTEIGLMKTKEQGQLTMPFDLCVTMPNMVDEILKHDFSGYLKNIVYDREKNGYYNNKYHIYYNHDKDCKNSFLGKIKIIRRYKNRINNYKSIIASDKTLIFVLNNYYQSENIINNLYDTIQKSLNKHKKFYFFLLDLECKIKPNFLNENIILCQKMHPWDHIDHWWYPENLQGFNNLRDELKPMIINLLKEKTVIKNIDI